MVKSEKKRVSQEAKDKEESNQEEHDHEKKKDFAGASFHFTSSHEAIITFGLIHYFS